MPATDIVQASEEVICTIVNADATLRTLMGRTTKLIVPWQTTVESGPLPVIVYALIIGRPDGGLRDTRKLFFTFTAFAEGNAARALANAILEQLEVCLSQPTLDVQGLDAAPVGWTRPGISDTPFGTRDVRRADAELELLITKS